MRGKPFLSLCMIVKNEEKNLPRCLDSVKDVVDEMIVVDTGSTDRTKEIALSYGAQVFDFEWIDDFSAARNYGLDRATGEWILVLDADEELEKKSEKNLRRFLLNTRADALEVTWRCFSDPSSSLTEYEDLSLVRVFRNNPHYRYVWQYHEQILKALKDYRAKIEKVGLDVIILHYGYLDTTIQRYERGIQIMTKMLRSEPHNFYIRAKLGMCYYMTQKYSDAYRELLAVIRDGDMDLLEKSMACEVFVLVSTLAISQRQFDIAKKCIDFAKLYLPNGNENLRGRIKFSEAVLLCETGENVPNAYQIFCELKASTVNESTKKNFQLWINRCNEILQVSNTKDE